MGDNSGLIPIAAGTMSEGSDNPPLPAPEVTNVNEPLVAVTPNGAHETPEDSLLLSPVPKGQGEHYRIHSDADVALEDDEMLEMQIQLAQAREQALVRQIEGKKRRINQSQSSPFNLSRELSALIGEDKSLLLREANATIEEMKQQHHAIVATLRTEKDAFMQNAKIQMDQEMMAFRESLIQHLQKESKDQAQNLAMVTSSEVHDELNVTIIF